MKETKVSQNKNSEPKERRSATGFIEAFIKAATTTDPNTLPLDPHADVEPILTPEDWIYDD